MGRFPAGTWRREGGVGTGRDSTMIGFAVRRCWRASRRLTKAGALATVSASGIVRGGSGMEFTDQMAAKLLAHAIRQLGQAVNETLCVTPDRTIVRAILKDVRATLTEFEDAYFEEPGTPPPPSA